MAKNSFKLNSHPVIVITDSGLGGLSVLADLEQLISHSNLFDEVRLVYFNSHAQHGHGYNSMRETSRKAEVFNNALSSMIDKFSPDLILIACNTLSIVYPLTETAQNSKVQIMGIAEFAVKMFYGKLAAEPDSKIILYGTPTTINSDEYKNKLIEAGIDSGRIINQPCYLLETEIQNNPSGARTEQMINNFTLQAKSMIDSPVKDDTKFYAGFCCTHYGYSKAIFDKVLSEHFGNYEILNPNFMMSKKVASKGKKGKGKTKIKIEVYSRVNISSEEINSIGKLIEDKAPLSYRALVNYHLDPNLFVFYREQE